MNQDPNDQTHSASDQLGASEKLAKAKNEKLRALLDGLELTPEQTKDDVAKPSNRDTEILGDVPPHHGN